ncbi:MAG: hypothetical protein ABII02_02745 [Candidatus Magasanikbacteria bacterium]
MNIKRAIGFGVMLWVLIFIEVSAVMFIPSLENKIMTQHIIHWIILIPMVLLLAKWYFKVDPPTLKKGVFLGLIGLVIAIILDLIITVPFFVKDYGFFGDWKLWVGMVEAILLTAFAGFEFDETYTAKVDKK